jgi:hypothetical protein
MEAPRHIEKPTSRHIERPTLPAPDLRESQLLSFSRAIRDEDSFTILYELAYSERPVSVESLRKTFGADFKHVATILERLELLGSVTEKGHAWSICAWAKAALMNLEECLENLQIEVSETRSASLDDSASKPDDIVGAVETGTMNGLWIATASRVTAFDRLLGAGTQTATHSDDAANLAPERSNRGQNETRSHLYK